MSQSALTLIGAICCFVAAALNVYAGNAIWIAGLLTLAGALMIFSYFKARGRR